MTAPRRVAEVLDGFIAVYLPKCVVLVTPEELGKLLAAHPEVYARALKRGKLHKRGLATARRTAAGVVA